MMLKHNSNEIKKHTAKYINESNFFDAKVLNVF